MLKDVRNIYFSGINGIGMSGLAKILAKRGYNVAGSDIEKKSTTYDMEEMGIKKESIEIWGQLDTLITQFDMIVEPFVGFSKTKIENFFPNEEEVSKIFSVPVEFFLENKPEWYDIVLKSSPIVIDPKTNEQKLIFPAKDLGLPEMYHNEWTTNVRKIPLYKTSDGVIWGFTAQVIINFVEKIIKF